MTEAPPIFVDAKEAARILGLSVFAIYDLLNKELLEGRYHGTKRLVVFASLQAYADSLPKYKGDEPAPIEATS